MTVTERGPEGDDGHAARGGRSRAVVVAFALCAAALVAAVVMAALWTIAALQSDSTADQAARDRDAAVAAAGDAVVALTTVSMDDVDGSLDEMHQVTTGELQEQFAPGSARDELAAQLEETGVSMTTDLNSAVLTSFDEDEGTASALTFVVRTQTLGPDQQRMLRQGIGLSLVDEDGQWKVNDFDTHFAGVGDSNGEHTGAAGDGGQPPGPPSPGPGGSAPGGSGQDGDQQNPAGS